MTHDAKILVHAARLEHIIGAFAARRYVEKRLINPANMRLWTQCRVMARAERAGF
jgi:hypothetical protein